MDVEEAVAAVQRTQLGLTTTEQARGAGVTAAGLRSRVASGAWVTVRGGARPGGRAPEPGHAVLAVRLAVGHACWASGRTAAARGAWT